MAEQCSTCNGRGWNPKVDFIKAVTLRIPCDKCRGTGNIVEKQANGFRVGRIICYTYLWQYLEFYKPVATLEVRVRPILDATGRPTFNKHKLFKRMIPRAHIEIVRMNTKPEYQGKGLMFALLVGAIGDSKIEWAETDWEDSTPEGRDFLLKRGFVHEGNKLIWERAYGELKGNLPDPARFEQQKANNGGCENGSGISGSLPVEDTQREAGLESEPESPAVP